MRIADFLTPDRVVLDLRARTKPRLIAEVAARFNRSDPSIDIAAVEAALLARERLGSTGLGGGFALPHARVEALPGYRGLFARLDKPIEFEAIDGAPVSMVFALLTPGAEASSHVGALAAVSRLFRDAAVRERLRQAKSAADAFQVLAEGGKPEISP
ncbi:MAG TPA: PTS sugar transporter subunit IIA [Rhodopila sp.]|uniref:PTS sugar transporter subunit IIA n=1 Tax=Rhodopila sp. TaxID=2480087 RepID=UPI002BEEDB0E|nr:PTS sugar transporter subunit IIA [Rhodopila sp.]HVY17709.1 PTS sugar transporter subunit IIA [Rhodopila sp.]